MPSRKTQMIRITQSSFASASSLAITSFALFLCTIQYYAITTVAAYPVAPVIGVLSQPHHLHNNSSEYIIAASYVKWLEAGGARSIPIPYDAPDELVDDLLLHVNGILFPGGGSRLPPTAWRIWERALEMNQQGDVFPIWGTCLGYEYLIQLASHDSEGIMLESGFDAENASWPLLLMGERTTSSTGSQLYYNARIQDIATNQDVGMNNHVKGVRPSVFATNEDLSTMFRVTSTNVDRQGKPFVSSIESDLYPFYGVQYHPEKNPFEYATHHGTDIPYENINHSPDAIFFSFHLSNFFVNMTRKNLHEHDLVTYRPVNTYELKRSMGFQEYFVIPSVASLLSLSLMEEELAGQEKASEEESN